jgi:hypothetical protein
MKSKKLELWRKRQEEFRKSGLTRLAFCAKRRLKISTLDYWFSRIRDLEKSQGLVELKTQGISIMKSSLEVIIADRYRIEIKNGFDAQLFAELVQALERRG